ncbi:MAG: DUF4198 domain-containing protein [Acidobacteriota bacterium]
MKTRSLLLTPAAVIALAIPVLSHDYWFEPEKLFVSVGDAVAVHLFVGEALKSDEERALQKDKTPSFRMFSVGEARDLKAIGADGQTPAAKVTFESPGNYLIAMERNWSSIKLDAKKFTEYLREEGLDSIVALREQSGESEKEARERYSRYLKSLLQVGTRHDETYKRELGFTLEIIPQTNPYELQVGDALKVKVLFEGKALPNAKVFADNREGGSTRTQQARTTADGIAALKLDRAGFWLVRIVHMRRCANLAEADWESFWAAYSFGAK